MRWESTTGALSLNLTRARPLPSCTWSSMHTLFGGWMGGWSYERRVERSRGKHKKDISLFKTTNTQNVFVLVITRLFIHKAVSVMTGWITAQNCSLSSIAWVILPRPHAHFCTGRKSAWLFTYSCNLSIQCWHAVISILWYFYPLFVSLSGFPSDCIKAVLPLGPFENIMTRVR